ncbi:MAG: DNA polymerase I [Candidatus Geothermincolia bacterium]
MIDGHSLAYRAFFALPVTMTTTGGQPTNAVFGFTSMLLKVLDEEKPDAVIVALDGPRADLERTREFPEYKAHRPTMPDELRGQIEMITHLLDHMRIPIVTAKGYEADDVLATIAFEVAGRGGEAVIVTGDRDTLQLVKPGVRVLMTGKGITETVTYDAAAVEERYGVPPERLVDIAGLKGDSSDNIPGVPGIGQKGACALIRQYGNLEGVYEHLDEITGAKRKASLTENRDIAFLSRKLATLNTELDLELDPSDVSFADWDKHEVLDYLSALEFKSLAKRFMDMYRDVLPQGSEGHGETLAYSMVHADDDTALETFLEDARNEGCVGACAVVSGSGYCNVELKGIAIAISGAVLFARESAPGPFGVARGILESPDVEICLHDGKATLEALDRKGVTASGVTFDTAIAAYLENPSLGAYHLVDIWERNLGGSINIEGMKEGAPAAVQQSLLETEPEDSCHGEDEVKAIGDAARIFHLKPVLEEKLHALQMDSLASDTELPLLHVLKDMEETGVRLDSAILQSLSMDAAQVLADLESDIYGLAGHDFNISSTRQLAEVLFVEMGLPATKKTKTGYSTDVSVLESLREAHEIAGKIIEYREYSKLKSTYFDVLPSLVCERTGRLHCSFNQTSTSTGRISSSSPNLQNIPVRTEVGRKIRQAFIPAESGWKMIVADYSQIELRVLAHMSADPLLLEAFERDEDIHTETAARVFGIPAEDVSSEMRRMAKVVNFGVVYGMGYYGLSSRLGISMEEATAYIDTYFETYDGVRIYRDDCIAEAARKGYSETLLGRRRFIPELMSPNRQTRELGERLAVNTPLQGTAADIIKKAMVDVARAIAAMSLSSRMTMQIHDELIFDVHPTEVEVMRSLVLEKMTRAVDLAVPLKVDSGVYNNWGEAKQ